VPEALASSLLPAVGVNKGRGWVGPDGSLWWAPPKPLALYHSKVSRRFELVRGNWAGLAPGDAWRGTVQVLVPGGPQLEEAQQQQQQGESCAGLGMPGGWREVVSTTCTLRCELRSRRPDVRVHGTDLIQQLEQLTVDHYLLRAHHNQVSLRCIQIAVPGGHHGPMHWGETQTNIHWVDPLWALDAYLCNVTKQASPLTGAPQRDWVASPWSKFT
jgi:uncharacterized protein YbdZ (MbtH family)